MRLILEPIDANGAAFVDDEPRGEMARILRDLAQRLEEGSEEKGGMYDYNGNRVGGWRIDV